MGEVEFESDETVAIVIRTMNIWRTMIENKQEIWDVIGNGVNPNQEKNVEIWSFTMKFWTKWIWEKLAFYSTKGGSVVVKWWLKK